MAKLGKLIGDGSGDYLSGKLRMARGDISIEIVRDEDSSGADGAPSHEVNVKRPDGGSFNVGSAWKLNIKRGDHAGKIGYSIETSHPEFPQFRAGVFPINDKEFIVQTERPRQAGGTEQ